MTETEKCLEEHLLPILWDDVQIVAVFKPAHMLSVPGKEVRISDDFKPRAEQWSNSIIQLCEILKENEDNLVDIKSLNKLMDLSSKIPRQRPKFFRFLERAIKITDQHIREQLWQQLTELDHKIHSTDLTTLPHELISAADIVEKTQLPTCKVHAVHRLDQETSGILIFAKSTEAASKLGQQFRDRLVSLISLAHFVFLLFT